MSKLLQEWVTLQAQQRPEATAIVLQADKLSYGQLEQLSNQLARLLKSKGCKQGDRICFLIPALKAESISICLLCKSHLNSSPHYPIKAS